jgi:hypothetical protein
MVFIRSLLTLFLLALMPTMSHGASRMPCRNQKSCERPLTKRFARVVSCTHRSLPDGRAEWAGVVEGNGEVHLTLHTTEGSKRALRWMGKVFLEGNRSTFNFITTSPRTEGLQWRVTARAR